MGAWLSVSVLAHEIDLMHDATGSGGRFHHVAFWYGIPQHLADGSKLFERKKSDWAWVEVADFSNAGLKNITRIAVSPKGNRIAVVSRQ